MRTLLIIIIDIALLYFVYLETGIATTLALTLVMVDIYHHNLALVNNLKLLKMITGSKL